MSIVNLNDILTNISKEYDIPLKDLMKYSQKNTKTICKCRARKADGLQCTRRSKNNSLFCGKHMDKRNFGCVADEEFIECSITKEKDTIYYIDEYGIMYKKLEENKFKIIGRKNLNTIEYI